MKNKIMNICGWALFLGFLSIPIIAAQIVGA